MQFLFWVVIAVFYLALAIGTWLMSRSIEEALAALKEPGDSLVSGTKSGKEVGLESTLYKAYKTIIITDIVGFVLAAIAAGISSL